MTTPEIEKADLNDPTHIDALIHLLNSYSDEPLAEDVRQRLGDELRKHPTTHVLLATNADGQPVGTAICFLGFSTFQAKPLLNLHDLVVDPASRGQGVGSRLLASVEEMARDLDCCRVTLEVKEDNPRAKALYHRSGFVDKSPTNEQKYFLEKELTSR